MSQSSFGCALCAQDGGALVWHSAKLRVVHVEEDGFPGYYRVIWNAHVAEFSDLSAEERAECMDAVVCVERALIEHLEPTKVNLAALGNQVPHLHWHVIARFEWDTHFPNAIWGEPQRARDHDKEAALRDQLDAVNAQIRDYLAKGEAPQEA
jgi:diadenosine tetraphosphate (Ap4A) HIT family hydrolase